MLPIKLTITMGGLMALADAENSETDVIRIGSIALSETAFDVSPTLTALPGEFKRVDAVGGMAVSETVIHMTAVDSSQDVYDLRGLGFFLDDGTLFGVYAQEDPIFRKVSIADFLLAFDVTFDNATAGNISFGDALFLNPPASEDVQGISRFASDGEADAGTSKSLAINPYQLKRAITAVATALGIDFDALEAWVQNQIAQLAARTITGTGLASGGGDLTQSRLISVTGASYAQMIAQAADNVVLTPHLFGLLPHGPGYFAIPGTVEAGKGPIIIQIFEAGVDASGEPSRNVTYPVTFAHEVLGAFPVTIIPGPSASNDVFYQIAGAPGLGSATIQRQRSTDASSGSTSCTLLVIGR